MLRMNKREMLFEEVKEPVAPAGGGAPNESQKPAPATPPANPGDSEKEGDSDTDEYGYKKVPAEPNSEEKKPEDVKPPADAKVPTAKTGYEDEPKAVEKKPDEKIPAVPPKDLKEELGYEIKFEGIEPDKVKEVVDLIKKHKLPQAAAQDLINQKKVEFDSQTSAQQKAVEKYNNDVAELKASWHKQLKDDPVFGGENFAASLLGVSKVLENHFPETQKVLTERKTMLPPSTMKDLERLSHVLYGGDKLVEGTRSKVSDTPKSDEPQENDPLAFYNT